MELVVGKQIDLMVHMAFGRGFSTVKFALCTVVEDRPKAVNLSAKTTKGKEITAWIPKRAIALVEQRDDGVIEANLQHWFYRNVEGWTSRWIEIVSEETVV
jgi:hypothetical protein